MIKDKYYRHILLSLFALLSLLQACIYEGADRGFEIENRYEVIGKAHYIDGISALFENGDINAVIEIPAGSDQKWEVDKTDGILKWEFVGGQPRRVQYLGYPANYGMIPQTYLPKQKGGDGDPLDVIVLGSRVERGKIVRCCIIGVLLLQDRGESDDKLIAVAKDGHFSGVKSMAALEDSYPGIQEILRTWFVNYKGSGVMISGGFGERDTALKILASAIEDYNSKGK